MSALISSSRPEQTMAGLQAIFLLMLPRIEQHAQIHFRHVRCPQQKDDAIAETVGIAWKWVIGLTQRGKDPRTFVSALAMLAARAVRSGRRLCGQETARDVLSPRAQQRCNFHVGKLPDFSTLSANPLADALIDNTQTPPDEQACFRLDFPVWLDSLGSRNRQVAQDLMMGERTLDVANRRQLTSARVSQLRRQFQEDWHLFCGEASSQDERPHGVQA